MKTTRRTVHFSIDGGWLTDHIRNLWAEGSFSKAFATLDAAFPEMQMHIQCAIISGKKKLEGVNNLTLLDDDWKPDTSRCAYGHYPDPLELPMLARKLAERVERLKPEVESMEAALTMQRVREQEEDQEREGCAERMIARGVSQLSLAEKIGSIQAAQLSMYGVPSPDQYIKTLELRDERAAKGKPKPDARCSSKYGGWILPDGKFYGCESQMEHIWLAEQLGTSERGAENMGWVKISVSGFSGTHILQPRDLEPTQSQINTVSVWCERHNADLPEWAGGKPD